MSYSGPYNVSKGLKWQRFRITWMAICLTWFLLDALSAGLWAQPRSGSPRPPDQSMGPWKNDVVVYRADREGWLTTLHTFERAGVPTVARLADGSLLAAFQYFPADDPQHFDRVALSASRDEGKTWTIPKPMVIEGMEPGMVRPFDPTLVPLPSGGVRMYFTSNGSRDFRVSPPKIYSAISQDNLHFVFEPGVRFAIEGSVTIDCACALHDNLFHLVIPDNGSPEEMEQNRRSQSPPRAGIGYHAVSRDGLNFERVADISTKRPNRWLGNLQSDAEELVFVGTGPGPWPLVSRDGQEWTTGRASFQIPGADPGMVKLQDGSWLFVVTSPPRQ